MAIFWSAIRMSTAASPARSCGTTPRAASSSAKLSHFRIRDAPFAPHGIVLKDDVLYVANLSDADTTKAGIAPHGRVASYDASTGEFLGNLTPPAGIPGQFNPRGIVFGPDDKLYVSVFDTSNLAAGHIVQYDLGAGTSSVFATNDGDGIDEPGEVVDLHRPEGLTFGPDGRLYVTSFRENANDIDRVLMLDGANRSTRRMPSSWIKLANRGPLPRRSCSVPVVLFMFPSRATAPKPARSAGMT